MLRVLRAPAGTASATGQARSPSTPVHQATTKNIPDHENLKHRQILSTLQQVFRACLARFKLVPVEEDGRKRKKRRMEGEREKEKRQEEEKGGSRQGGEARKGTLLTGLMITSNTVRNAPGRPLARLRSDPNRPPRPKIQRKTLQKLDQNRSDRSRPTASKTT